MHTNVEVEDLILEVVKKFPGIKAVELVVEVYSKQPELVHDDIDVVDMVYNLVESNRLIEEEYVDPDMSYRVKSRFFVNAALVGA